MHIFWKIYFIGIKQGSRVKFYTFELNVFLVLLRLADLMVQKPNKSFNLGSRTEMD
jgi:hypothetical protein